jgi:Reverse transcriptase (RNA-dependent DNA polymerase)/gag-polypeptide of LTR copia-type/GAG-pre-integrase domain/Integrase core domain
MSSSSSQGLKEKLTNDNFPSWKSHMVALLTLNNVWKVVSGRTQEPQVVVHSTSTVVDAKQEAAMKLRDEWESLNEKAHALITLSLSANQLSHTRGESSAAKVWKNICDAHQPKGAAGKFYLLARLFNMRQTESVKMQDHLNAITDLAIEIEDLGFKVPEELLVTAVLGSVNSGYENLVSALWITPDSEINMKMISTRLLHEERRKAENAESSNTTTTALYTAQSRFKQDTMKGNTASVPTCTHCNKQGHSKETCFEIVGYPRWHRKNKNNRNNQSTNSNNNNSNNDVNAFVVTIGGNKTTTNWYVDSAASAHICCSRELFTNFESIPPIEITVGDSRKTNATGRGDISTQILVNRKPITVRWTNVLFCPQIGFNLLSVGKMTTAGALVSFIGNQCLIQNKRRELIGIGERQENNTFLLPVTVNSVTSNKPISLSELNDSICLSATAATENKQAELWHHRLGHLSLSGMKLLQNHNMAKDSLCALNDHELKEKIDACKGCNEGKSHRKSMPQFATHRATEMLQLIHSDICGPMQANSLSGSRYFITFIDDYSRYITVKTIQKKSEAMNAFLEFKSWSENLTGKRIKAFRSDGGGEYSSDLFDEYLKKCGISKQQTPPYTPEHNGVAERANRTIIESARSMLRHANLEPKYWAESVVTAVYIRNRSPSRTLNNITPYEAWHGQKPSINHLRVFGCLAWVHIPKAKRQKLDPKATLGIFVGYSAESKAYRIFDPKAGVIKISRDVQFLENRFENNMIDTTSQSQNSDLFPEIIFTPNDITAAETKAKSPLTAEDYEGMDSSGYLDPLFPITSTEDEESKSVADFSVNNSSSISSISDPSDQSEEAEKLPVTVPRRSNRLNPVNIPVNYPSANSMPARATPATSFSNFLKTDLDAVFHPMSSDFSTNASDPPSDLDSTNESALITVKESNGEPQNNAQEFMENEPSTYAEAMSRPDRKQWELAAQDEYKSIQEAGTWTLVPLPAGRQAIGCRWLFKIKRKIHGAFDRYKARLVAKGYAQKEGVDYTETFAPVTRFSSIRTLIALAAYYDMEIHQMDVKTAFLHGDLDVDIYMNQPDGFVVKGAENLVCKLKKSLYGLKQAGRAWYQKIDTALLNMRFDRLETDHCVYVLRQKQLVVFIALYVDDLLLLSNDLKGLTIIKQELSTLFTMKDLGEAHYVLGIEIERKRDIRTIHISQTQYIKTIVARYGLADSKPSKTPLNPSILLTKADSPTTAAEIEEMKRIPYQSAVGAISFAMQGTRPDIAFAVNKLSQYSSNPGPNHWMALKTLIRYLSGTQNYKLTYNAKGDSTLFGYCDSDYASCVDSRRSVTGYVFFLCGGAISWQSRKQPTVASSSVEAEYMACAHATKEAIWWRTLLSNLGKKIPNATTIYTDSQGAIALAKNPTHHPKTKHIDVQYHFIRETIARKVIHLDYMPTTDMVADVLTKSLERVKHEKMVQLLGISSSRD